MRSNGGGSWRQNQFLLIYVAMIMFTVAQVKGNISASDISILYKRLGDNEPLCSCDQCSKLKVQDLRTYTTGAGISNYSDEKDINVIVAYSDISGAVRTSSVKAEDLSSSWIWENPLGNKLPHHVKDPQIQLKNDHHTPVDGQLDGDRIQHLGKSAIKPVKLLRKKLREERWKQRTAELIRQEKEMDNQMQEAAIERSQNLDTTAKTQYSIWRRDYENPNSDSTLKLMRDQIIMAKVYATIAKAKNDTGLYTSLIKHSRESRDAIGEATTDTELDLSALEHAKAMGHALSVAKDQLFDCLTVARKLRAIIQSTEDNINAMKKKSAFLTQLAAKTVTQPLHCLSLLLATDYYNLQDTQKKDLDKAKVEDPSLYHYAIFSDNVLATSVVVNSTLTHTAEPEKHVFHVVTDKLNFAAMKMWFLANLPPKATVQVENIDDFKWLNSSYCVVLRQLESARMKDYYFKANLSSSLSVGADNLKYRNPKYLSMLNHLRFYLPEVYPKLEKILFLDDDIVVQKDLTPLWSVDMKGMVNGAVETCKESFHRFDKYLNFSNPKIYENFDSNACGWAFGMNMFDLREWRKQDITGIYHHWQNLNEDRTLWKLGSLPPGLITFYNLTFPLQRSWHVLGLGYDPALNKTEIDNAAVVHYNGNYKPWLDLAISKYKSYWSRYLTSDNPYLQHCKIIQ
uniref:Hexosyltransferase n=1 Tax=Kalanchoe fedtschenkoi TaxID=63787 RepID=A0A7N0U6A6_KALFE